MKTQKYTTSSRAAAGAHRDLDKTLHFKSLHSGRSQSCGNCFSPSYSAPSALGCHAQQALPWITSHRLIWMHTQDHTKLYWSHDCKITAVEFAQTEGFSQPKLSASLLTRADSTTFQLTFFNETSCTS